VVELEVETPAQVQVQAANTTSGELAGLRPHGAAAAASSVV
jgi:hypothetical protein